jgi:hypothetical protein
MSEKQQVVLVNKLLPGLKASYQHGKIQIIYIDNVADWITIRNNEQDSLMDFIGLLEMKEKLNEAQTWRTLTCYEIHGLKKVKIYRDREGKILFLHIKAFTP